MMCGSHALLEKAADPLEVHQGIPESGRHRDNAGAGAPVIIQDLRKDWSKQLTGIAVLEAVAEDVTGEIEGVAIRPIRYLHGLAPSGGAG